MRSDSWLATPQDTITRALNLTGRGVATWKALYCAKGSDPSSALLTVSADR